MKKLVSILAFGYEMMNEEDDEAEGSRRSLPTKQIKIIFELYFPIYLVVYMTLFSCRMFALMIVFY